MYIRAVTDRVYDAYNGIGGEDFVDLCMLQGSVLLCHYIHIHNSLMTVTLPQAWHDTIICSRKK